jgi:hypothetical protein
MHGPALPQTISIVVSVLALAISVATAWLTLFRRGTVRMTQPTTIYFGADASSSPSPKVYLRTLLYSTAKRGQIIESMFVKLRRGESIQTFNIWVYGEGSLARGSGLYVGENGVTCNHHFLLPADGTKFEFLPGEYKVEVYASLAGGPAFSVLLILRVADPSWGSKGRGFDFFLCAQFNGQDRRRSAHSWDSSKKKSCSRASRADDSPASFSTGSCAWNEAFRLASSDCKH